MEPFYFGKDSDLFGMYHMAEGMPRRHGILIAGPLLNEGLRAQFALRLIANRCAALGYDVLRFDYAGHGNSLGRPADYSIARWQDDIITAARELESISGTEVKTVICVRFAASLVASVSRSMQLERLLLWDPVLAGDDWLAELCEARQHLPELLSGAAGLDQEYSGHAVNQSFADDLALRKVEGFNAESVFAVTSRDYRQADRFAQVAGVMDSVESDCRWRTGASEILYPGDIIEVLCSQLA
jgi:pimeloyl-ACP methyl ester carboxylesterase